MARLKKEDVFPLVKGVLKGDLGKSDFYELTNLRAGGYYYWLRKYKNVYGDQTSSFVPVRSKKQTNLTGQVAVILGSDVEIRFTGKVSAQYLRELVGRK